MGRAPQFYATEESPQEIATGDARAREEAAHELRGAIERYAMLVALVGTLADADALNSTVANELPQAQGRVVDALDELGSLTTRDADLAGRVADLQRRFSTLTSTVTDKTQTGSLVSLRYARFAERRRTAQIRSDCAATAQQLLGVANDVQSQADEIATRARKVAELRAHLALGGSILLTLLGAALCALASRRIASSAADLRAQNQHLIELKLELQKVNEGLELTVAERTQELRRREQSLQLVLDTTGDGLVSVGLDGAIRGEQSRAIREWFGAQREGSTVWNLLYSNDARCGADSGATVRLHGRPHRSHLLGRPQHEGPGQRDIRPRSGHVGASPCVHGARRDYRGHDRSARGHDASNPDTARAR